MSLEKILEKIKKQAEDEILSIQKNAEIEVGKIEDHPVVAEHKQVPIPVAVHIDGKDKSRLRGRLLPAVAVRISLIVKDRPGHQRDESVVRSFQRDDLMVLIVMQDQFALTVAGDINSRDAVDCRVAAPARSADIVVECFQQLQLVANAVCEARDLVGVDKDQPQDRVLYQ